MAAPLKSGGQGDPFHLYHLVGRIDMGGTLLDRARDIAQNISTSRIEDVGDKGDKWRVVEMRKQMPSSGTIPILIARDVPWQKGCCLSCGDRLAAGQDIRCLPCIQAAILVIEEARGEA